MILKAVAPDGYIERKLGSFTRAMERYAETLEPWAEAVAEYMVRDTDQRIRKLWKQHAKELGKEIRQELDSAPTGFYMRELMNRQIGYIKSIPLEAAQRVHRLAIGAQASGARASEIAKEILRTEDVTLARANLIARTEVARASSALTQARARYAGSEGYVWRTAGDADVRDEHAEMEGKYVRWDTRPLLANGRRAHAGEEPNCRCYPEPVFPEDD